MSIDDRKKNDSNALNTFIVFYYEFDEEKLDVDSKVAAVALVTDNKNGTSLLERLYLPLESFYVSKKMIVNVRGSGNFWY